MKKILCKIENFNKEELQQKELLDLLLACAMQGKCSLLFMNDGLTYLNKNSSFAKKLSAFKHYDIEGIFAYSPVSAKDILLEDVNIIDDKKLQKLLHEDHLLISW